MAQNPIFVITMEDGREMKGELYPEIAPQSVGNFIALDVVAGAADAHALGVAALDHEAGDDAVEDQPIVEAGIGQGDEVAHGLGRDLRVELTLHLAAILHGDDKNGILCHK